MIDIDGGIGTLFVLRRQGPPRTAQRANSCSMVTSESLAKDGAFVGRHIVTPLHGAAVHINAFNFPCWGLLEKLAPALLAGVPVITKPATITSYVAQRWPDDCRVRPFFPTAHFNSSSARPATCSITSPVRTSCRSPARPKPQRQLQRHPIIARNAVRFIAERDSLNAAILAPDAGPGTPEFDLFIREVAKEMTVKAGQKCTAIRRAHGPVSACRCGHHSAARAARQGRRSATPNLRPCSHGAARRARPTPRRAWHRSQHLRGEAELVYGDPDDFSVEGADAQRGAFVPPLLLHCADPRRAPRRCTRSRPSGRSATVMGYSDLDQAIALANRGDGSLVASRLYA